MVKFRYLNLSVNLNIQTEARTSQLVNPHSSWQNKEIGMGGMGEEIVVSRSEKLRIDQRDGDRNSYCTSRSAGALSRGFEGCV